jgi:hypothetical protein
MFILPNTDRPWTGFGCQTGLGVWRKRRWNKAPAPSVHQTKLPLNSGDSHTPGAQQLFFDKMNEQNSLKCPQLTDLGVSQLRGALQSVPEKAVPEKAGDCPSSPKLVSKCQVRLSTKLLSDP